MTLQMSGVAPWAPSSPRPSSPSLPPIRREKREKFVGKSLKALSLPAVGGEAGRERVGRVRAGPEGAAVV